MLSYAEVLKTPAQKLIKTAQVTINAHEIKEFVQAQNQATQINQIDTRKAAAIKSKADILKLNTEQWTSLKESVKSDTGRGPLRVSSERNFAPGTKECLTPPLLHA